MQAHPPVAKDFNAGGGDRDGFKRIAAAQVNATGKAMNRLSRAAGQAFDFRAHEAFDDAGQVLV
jgi:hypothetical protein